MIRAPIRLACVLFLAALCGLRADPSTFTWTGEISNDVNTLGNWAVDGSPADAAPTADDTLLFGPALNTYLVFSASSAVAKVVITGSEPLAYTFGGPTTTLSLAGASGEGLRVEGNTKVEFSANLTLTVSGSQTWFMDSGTTAYIDGPISSPSAITLTKQGSGDLHVRGLTSGLSGNVAVSEGKLHLWTTDAFENATVSVASGAALASAADDGTTIGSEVSLASGAKLGSSENTAGRNQLVFTDTVTAGSSVVLAEDSVSYFDGAFNGTVADSNITFSGGGFAVLLGPTDTATLTADGSGLVVNTSGSLPSGALLATNGGYVGMGAGFTSDVTPNATAAAFITRIASPGSFAGTLGFDTDPRLGGAPNVFTGAIDLTSFTNAGFLGLGSATHANISGTITPPTGATAYLFGGGGGRLTVGSGLTGSFGLSVISPVSDPLTLVLTGDNSALAGAVTVQNSYLVFDSANAMPAGTISLGSSGYVSATATAGLDASALLGKIISSDATSILGFDSSLPASTARTVSDPIALGSFSGYLGTTTFKDDGLKLTGTITGPTAGPSIGVLRLAGLNNGKLTVASPLLGTNNISSVLVGHPDAELGRNGTVVLSGASDYIGGTTLQRGTLLLGSNSAGDGSTGPLGKSTGALTVKHNADGEAAVLAPAVGSATLLNDIILEADPYLKVGLDAGNLTLGGKLSGSGQLWFVGPTITTLAGTSTRDGETYVKDTTVNVDANTGLASTHLFVINSTVAFGSAASAPTIGSLSGTPGSVMSFGAANTTLTINQTLETNPVIENKYAGTFAPSGTLSLVKTGEASLWLSQANTISGNVTVNAGSLGFSGNGSIGGELKVNAGSVNFGNTGTFTTGNAYIGNQATQTGAAEVFAGSTWVSTGYVKVGAADQANGFLSIASGGALQTSGVLYIGHADYSSGMVEVAGTGATLSAASLVIGDGTAATGSLGIWNGGEVSISGQAEIREAGSISISDGDGPVAGSFTATGGLINNGSLSFTHATPVTFSTAISGSGQIEKFGTGSLVLSGPNASYAGEILLGSGDLTLGSDTAAGIGQLRIAETTGLAVEFTTAAPVMGTLAGGMNDTMLTLKANSQLTMKPTADTEYLGSIAGVGASIVIQGTGAATPVQVAFSGAHSYSGGTTITNGAVVVARNNAALGTAGTVTLSGGTLSVDTGQTLAFTSAHPLVLSNGTLAGAGTYSLDSSSSLSIGAGRTISPGLDVPAALTFDLNSGSATLTFDSNGTYLWRLQDDSGSGTLASSMQVAGTLSIAATLVPFHLKLATFNASGAAGPASNFDPSSPMSWTLLTATSIAGFDAAKFAIDAGLFSNAPDQSLFSIAQSGNSLVLNFTPVPEPSTWVLMLTGLSVVALRAFRRRRQS